MATTDKKSTNLENTTTEDFDIRLEDLDNTPSSESLDEQLSDLEVEEEEKEKTPMRQIVIGLLIVTLLALIGITGYFIYNRYVNTNQWKNTPAQDMPMADQNPDLLSDDDPDSQDAKARFLNIYQQVYNEDTKALAGSIDQHAMDTMASFIASIREEDRARYQELFDTVDERWVMFKTYQDLFETNELTTLQPSVTPETIQLLNNQHFDQIQEWVLESDNQDEFAKQMFDLQDKLAKDSQVINDMTHIFSTYVSLSSDLQGELNLQAVNNDISTYNDLKNKLHFTWNSLELQGQLESVIQPLLDRQAQERDRAQQYQQEQSMIGQLQENNQQEQFQFQQDRDQTFNNARQEAQDNHQAALGQLDANQIQQEYIELPNFLGQNSQQVQLWAQQHNIAVQFYEQESSYPPGTVIQMNPSSDYMLKRTATLEITLAR